MRSVRKLLHLFENERVRAPTGMVVKETEFSKSIQLGKKFSKEICSSEFNR